MYKGLRSGVQPVAVKVLNEHTPKQLADFQREIHILRGLHDTNVVQFLGVCQRQVCIRVQGFWGLGHVVRMQAAVHKRCVVMSYVRKQQHISVVWCTSWGPASARCAGCRISASQGIWCRGCKQQHTLCAGPLLRVQGVGVGI